MGGISRGASGSLGEMLLYSGISVGEPQTQMRTGFFRQVGGSFTSDFFFALTPLERPTGVTADFWND